MLALIVIVAEAVILAAMKMTAAGNPVLPYYPVLMLLFLVVVVAGLVFDRLLESKKFQQTLTMNSGGQKLSIQSTTPAVVDPPAGVIPESLYVDSQREFQLELPKSGNWSPPKQFNDIGCYFVELGILADSNAIPAFKEALAIAPMGKMIADSWILSIAQGKQIVAEFTDATTNDAIEGALKRYVQFAEGQGEKLTDQQLSTIRSDIVRQKNPLSRIPVQNCFSVTILDKTLATDSEIEPTLANLFVQNIAAVGGTVDRLVADDRAILAGSSQTWRNVLVDGKQGELSYFNINQYIESDRYVYIINIVFSPQTRKSLEVWEDLQRMMSSFKMLSAQGGRRKV